MNTLIGAGIPRLEDGPLLKGHGRFVDDIALPGVLQAAFVRSPHPHALIARVDTRAAAALPGVDAVLTLEGIVPVLAQRRMVRHSNSGIPLGRLWPFALADREVSYVGEPVAIVIAEDRYVAEDAAALVEVEYELLPAVADCRNAIAPDVAAIRRELNSNVVTTFTVAYGDADAALAEAAHIFHEELWQHRGSGHPIECRGLAGR